MSNTLLENFWQYALNSGNHLDAKLITIPNDLMYLKGEVQGETVEMQSQAWCSERITWARITHLFSPSRIQMFNFTIYPATQYAAPIFASDFVVLGNKLRVGIIDAMPLKPEDSIYEKEWINPFAPWHQQSLSMAEVYERKLGWSFEYLGKYACMATAASVEQMPTFFELWKNYLNTFLSILENTKLTDEENQQATKSWFEKYNHSHLAVENQRNPLLSYFGKTLGERYNAEFLFNSAHLK